MLYKLLDACREKGCPVCRVEQYSVERYLENQFYENVNSPKWRGHLRGSLGFCHEHAWLAVDKRLGDALGFSLIYQDILKSILKTLDDGGNLQSASRPRSSSLKKLPDQARTFKENSLNAMIPVRRCPVCEHREETARMILSALVEGLDKAEVVEALQSSDALCLPHLQQSLTLVREHSVSEQLLAIHRSKLEGLVAELAEFIRKNDYLNIHEGFGKERDAWMRAIAQVVGSSKRK
ncbi:MAG TPA: DUF6062 family protein [Anaerolineales bacterium]|nr:DUF6062 family protein [Anaerolineales bacterium]